MQEIIYLRSGFYLMRHRFPGVHRLQTASLELGEPYLSIKPLNPILTGSLGSRPQATLSLPLLRVTLCQKSHPSADHTDGGWGKLTSPYHLPNPPQQAAMWVRLAQHGQALGGAMLTGQDLDFCPRGLSHWVLISALKPL